MDVDVDVDGTEMEAEAVRCDLPWLWRGLRRRASVGTPGLAVPMVVDGAGAVDDEADRL
jgi:hypothetical protein